MEDSSSLDLYLLLFGGTITILLLAIGLVMFMFQYQKKIIRKDLIIKETEVKHSQDLFLGTLQATEKERERIARELHDVIGASLSAMRLQLADIGMKSIEDKNLSAFIIKNKELIDNTILEVRRISNDLLPPGLEEFGLAYAIEGLCETILSCSNLDISLKVGEIGKIEKQKSLIVYRIVQELLNNSIKHADATQIVINLSLDEGYLLMIYVDNGKGFDFSEAYKKRSLGLKNIEVRAKMVDGSARFETKIHEGIKVHLWIPK
jgi:signal transduction histidine kinase